ncbi:MAG: DNA primase [bacterium]|nr:DNA primase [bacterium]
MSDIDEIKSRLNIVDTIASRVKLQKTGRNLKGLCPFHNEKTPSFLVSPDRQLWRCFGCGKGGSIFDFVMEYEHIDFVEALETLAEKARVKLERRIGDTPQDKLKHRIYEVNHLASEFFHYLLTEHALGENARLYLKNRHISEKSMKTFCLGYSPNSWEGLFKYLRKKGYEGELLEKAGLVLPGSRGYYDRFRGRVMFALRDHRGNVVGFSGRLLDPNAKDAKYINTKETPVYTKGNVLYGLEVTKEAILKEHDAIIMEGELDVITSFQAGVSNVVGIKGSALTEGHVQLLRRFTDRLTFALDSDIAGDAAARRGIEVAEKAGLDMKVVVLPEGKDPDDLGRENPGRLKKAIHEAIPIYDYFLRSAVDRFDQKSAYGKKKISEELLPIYAKIDNAIVQAHYVKMLAQTLDTPEESVLDRLRTIARATPRPRVTQVVPSSDSRTRQENLELYFLALLIQGKTVEMYEEFKENLSYSDLGSPAVARILQYLDAYTTSQRVFLLRDFLDTLPSELTRTLDDAFLEDVGDVLENEEKRMAEWTKTIRDLRRLVVKRKIQEMSQTIQEIDVPAPDTRVFQEAMNELMSELKALEQSG